MASNVSAGDVVLLVWCEGQSPERVKELVERLQEKVGSSGQVKIENAERLKHSAHPSSSIDIALLGALNPVLNHHDEEILSEVVRVLRPSGRLHVKEPTVTTANGSDLRTKEKLISALTLSGFVNISEATVEQLNTEEEETVSKQYKVEKDKVQLVAVSCTKPNYEVGSSSSLSIRLPKQLKLETKTVTPDVTNVWTLSSADMGDDDLNIIDEDDLLEDEDLLKPSADSLKADCGPGKKKACKNCSCGLAEELANGDSKPVKTKPVTSACGSCYLGDAFRCASCPYLGMPAFKPGEKIALSNRQLNADA
ncbi:putative anamorsin-like isoform X2 [Apostichopus japonicus]|uniref:Anamorsin homolog n=1 Tax=Stichopus japonicus TaxID=307972 RepID=A0A2G8LNH7_STIJA|nr:putative anamorsin-like isoform X2 [Apostichopus japonicus]